MLDTRSPRYVDLMKMLKRSPLAIQILSDDSDGCCCNWMVGGSIIHTKTDLLLLLTFCGESV